MPPFTRQKVVTVLAAWIGLLWCSLSVAAADIHDRIVAVVNTDIIALSELEEEVAEVARQAQKRFGGAELDQRLRQIDYMGLNRMIERKLQLQIAKRRGITISEGDVQDALVRLRRMGESPNEQDPREMGLIRDQLTAMRLLNQQIRSGLIASDEELLRFYQQHQERFMLPPEVRISQILMALNPAVEMLEVREKARQVFALLQKGGRFEDLASQYSDGPEGQRGGSLGYIRPGDMLPQIQKAIEQLAIGSITEPLASPVGMHIIRVDDRKPPQFRPYEEVKEDIRNMVLQLKTEEAYMEWIKEQKDKSYIEIKR